MEFKLITKEDYTKVARIYKQGLETGLASFETQVPDWETWDSNHLPFVRIGVTNDNILVGWAALSNVSNREVYKGVAEVSVYVANEYKRRGVGTTLLNELINQSETHGIWTLQSGIMSENRSSIHIHEQCGFRKIGFREKIGQLNGVWLDNVILERRSKIVGI